MRTTIAVSSVALSFIYGAHIWTTVDAQSRSASSAAIPNLTGIWHRKGPLNAKPNAPAVPTNRAAGFEKAFDDAYNPTYDCSATPVPSLMHDDYDFQITQQSDRVILEVRKDGRRANRLAGRPWAFATGRHRLHDPGALRRPVRTRPPGDHHDEVRVRPDRLPGLPGTFPGRR